jgi:hypothetical protein
LEKPGHTVPQKVKISASKEKGFKWSEDKRCDLVRLTLKRKIIQWEKENMIASPTHSFLLQDPKVD